MDETSKVGGIDAANQAAIELYSGWKNLPARVMKHRNIRFYHVPMLIWNPNFG